MGLTLEEIKLAEEICNTDINCNGCPLKEDNGCTERLVSAAVEIIEEQQQRIAELGKRDEPVKVRHLHNAKVTMHEEVAFTDECGNCGGYLMKNWKACPLCGRSVKWE